MKNLQLFCFFAYFLLGCSFIQAQNPTLDKSVFGIKIDEKLSVSECRIVENNKKNQNSILVLKYFNKKFYYADDNSLCFMRDDTRYNKLNPPFSLPNNEFIVINFPLDSSPQMSSENKVKAFIDSNGNVAQISFETYSDKTPLIFEVLKKKYGQPSSIVPFTQTTLLNETLKYEVIEWTFPRFTVTYQTMDERGMPYSKYGRVLVSNKTKRQTNVPL